MLKNMMDDYRMVGKREPLKESSSVYAGIYVVGYTLIDEVIGLIAGKFDGMPLDYCIVFASALICILQSRHAIGLYKMFYLCPLTTAERKACIWRSYIWASILYFGALMIIIFVVAANGEIDSAKTLHFSVLGFLCSASGRISNKGRSKRYFTVFLPLCLLAFMKTACDFEYNEIHLCFMLFSILIFIIYMFNTIKEINIVVHYEEDV